jgi:hypothetical protein
MPTEECKLVDRDKIQQTRSGRAAFSTNEKRSKILARRADRFFIRKGVSSRFVTPTIARRLTVVIAVLLSALTLGMLFYRELFRFWQYPLSDLGATRTEHGLSNIPSIIFFDSGMIMSGLLMFSISARFKASTVEHRMIKRALTFLSGIGFLIIIFPYNINDSIHMTGGGAVFGGLWGLAVLLSLEMRHGLGTLRFWLIQLLLQGTILPYAALFVLGKAIKQVFQKPAVLGLMLALGLALWMRKKAGPVPAPPGRR